MRRQRNSRSGTCHQSPRRGDVGGTRHHIHPQCHSTVHIPNHRTLAQHGPAAVWHMGCNSHPRHQLGGRSRSGIRRRGTESGDHNQAHTRIVDNSARTRHNSDIQEQRTAHKHPMVHILLHRSNDIQHLHPERKPYRSRHRQCHQRICTQIAHHNTILHRSIALARRAEKGRHQAPHPGHRPVGSHQPLHPRLHLLPIAPPKTAGQLPLHPAIALPHIKTINQIALLRHNYSCLI